MTSHTPAEVSTKSTTRDVLQSDNTSTSSTPNPLDTTPPTNSNVEGSNCPRVSSTYSTKEVNAPLVGASNMPQHVPVSADVTGSASRGSGSVGQIIPGTGQITTYEDNPVQQLARCLKELRGYLPDDPRCMQNFSALVSASADVGERLNSLKKYQEAAHKREEALVFETMHDFLSVLKPLCSEEAVSVAASKMPANLMACKVSDLLHTLSAPIKQAAFNISRVMDNYEKSTVEADATDTTAARSESVHVAGADSVQVTSAAATTAVPGRLGGAGGSSVNDAVTWDDVVGSLETSSVTGGTDMKASTGVRDHFVRTDPTMAQIEDLLRTSKSEVEVHSASAASNIARVGGYNKRKAFASVEDDNLRASFRPSVGEDEDSVASSAGYLHEVVSFRDIMDKMRKKGRRF